MPSKLYRNLGGGKFEDVTRQAGVADPHQQVARHRRASITTATAGPTSSSPTTRSRTSSTATSQNGTFKEEGLAAGVAFGEDGVARGAMGVDAADYDRSGRAHLIVGNFSNQMLGLYHNEGNGLFVDEAPRSPVGRASLLSSTFGVFFFDYDLDGYPDIFAANGHIEEEIGRVQPKIQYASCRCCSAMRARASSSRVQRVHQADRRPRRRLRRFRPRRRSGRPHHHQPRSRVSLPQRWRQSEPLASTQADRHEEQPQRIGAVVRVTSAGGKQWQTVHSGSSYCSASDLALTFGLGKGRRRHRRSKSNGPAERGRNWRTSRPISSS